MNQTDLFGRLTWKAFERDSIEIAAGISIVGGALFVVALLFYLKRWKWLWHTYLTSLDPKKIGVMYLTIAALMLFKGAIDGLMMRAQQAISVGDSFGYLSQSHYQQIFTAHGTTMIFFVGMGVVFGMMNLIIPLQIGARDVAFPFLNAISFWFFFVGSALLVISLNIGEFAGVGWIAYPPLSGLEYNPGVGVDYWIWSVQIAGIGSLLSGINFFVTIFKMRCPGMTLLKIPLFTWSALTTLVLVIFAFPILTATIAMLTLDRYLEMHFFTSAAGGNPMLYVNLIWAWGHPEVYILILPAFGVFSEVVPTFSQKKIFGYLSMVWALIAITFLSFLVWLHHFFTMGASANVNLFFGIMTMVIAVPTGVKVFNWLFTNYRGKIIFSTPMIWFLGFVINFTIGGMAGVLMSVPPADFQVHNSLFLIAHFHSMILPGVLFGFFAAFNYWFPKFTGFKLNEKLGRCACWCWIIGFQLAFYPLYFLGLDGATRRLDHYEASTGWQPLFILALFGVLLIIAGLGFQGLQVAYSIKKRNENPAHDNPWNGRTLEWATSSPPPLFNFAFIPEVIDRDVFTMKKGPPFEEIEVPKNSPFPVVIGALVLVFGFAFVWHIWWMVIFALLGVILCLAIHLANDETEELLSQSQVEAACQNH